MINQDRWINSLPIKKTAFNEKINQVDSYRWVNTISKKRTYNAVKKYSVMLIMNAVKIMIVLTNLVIQNQYVLEKNVSKNIIIMGQKLEFVML